jgi:hypothetical protein
MECVACRGTAISDRPERTAQGYRRFSCRDCGKRFNEPRSRCTKLETALFFNGLRGRNLRQNCVAIDKP